MVVHYGADPLDCLQLLSVNLYGADPRNDAEGTTAQRGCAPQVGNAALGGPNRAQWKQ